MTKTTKFVLYQIRHHQHINLYLKFEETSFAILL